MEGGSEEETEAGSGNRGRWWQSWSITGGRRDAGAKWRELLFRLRLTREESSVFIGVVPVKAPFLPLLGFYSYCVSCLNHSSSLSSMATFSSFRSYLSCALPGKASLPTRYPWLVGLPSLDSHSWGSFWYKCLKTQLKVVFSLIKQEISCLTWFLKMYWLTSFRWGVV